MAGRWTQTLLSAEAEGYDVRDRGRRRDARLRRRRRRPADALDAERRRLAAETIEPEGATINAMAWNPDLGLVGVGSNAGNLALWRLGCS